MIRNYGVRNSKALTQFIFGTLFEFLVGHQLFDTTSLCLHMINDQFIKVRISIRCVHDELTSGLVIGIGIRINDI